MHASTGGNIMAMPRLFSGRHWRVAARCGHIATALRILLALIYLASFVTFGPVHVSADSGWTAYNDCAWTTGQIDTNITKYTISGSTSGPLKDFATGAETGVTASFSSSGSPQLRLEEGYGGVPSDPGTDAHEIFDGFVDTAGIIQYGSSSSGWSVTLTLSGLDPARTYTFAATANRGDSGYTDRVTRYTLSGADGATNASSGGVTVINDFSVAFNTGDNTQNGYVARWTGIRPGSDGTITVRAEPHGDNKRAYAFSAFMLQEEGGAPPDEYALTVHTTGSGSVTLDPPGDLYASGTEVTLTPVPGSGYTFDGWGGVDADDLIDNGDGSWSIIMDAPKTVSATFVPSAGAAWTAYNDCAWTTGQIDTNITTYTISGSTSGPLTN